MYRLAVVLALLACVVNAQWRGCGDNCVNSNQCNDALCSKCDPGTRRCVSGDTCNTTCIVDSDCERLRYCYLCTSGSCGSGPIYPAQCKVCETDTDCDPNSNCKYCLEDRDSTGKITKRCAAGCGGTCRNSYDCGYGTSCSYCDGSHTCQKGQQCGAVCGTNADCDQSSNCKLCIDYTCSAPCNSDCATSFDCNVFATGCGLCRDRKCIPGVECGSRCQYDRDCAAAGACTSCVDEVCSAVPSKCDTPCSSNAECGNVACPSCTAGRCAATACGSACSSDLECRGASGGCNRCVSGQCSPAACGSSCSNHGDCNEGSGCAFCLNSRCSRPQCYTPCESDSDCTILGGCSVCQGRQCQWKLPENCGEHSKCDPGNNNQCPQSSCSRCDPFTATCRIGGECGAACIVSTDCNQLSACKWCSDICVDNRTLIADARKAFGSVIENMSVQKVQELLNQKRK